MKESAPSCTGQGEVLSWWRGLDLCSRKIQSAWGMEWECPRQGARGALVAWAGRGELESEWRWTVSPGRPLWAALLSSLVTCGSPSAESACSGRALERCC